MSDTKARVCNIYIPYPRQSTSEVPVPRHLTPLARPVLYRVEEEHHAFGPQPPTYIYRHAYIHIR